VPSAQVAKIDGNVVDTGFGTNQMEKVQNVLPHSKHFLTKESVCQLMSQNGMELSELGCRILFPICSFSPGVS
jgi:hypothetical protein